MSSLRPLVLLLASLSPLTSSACASRPAPARPCEPAPAASGAAPATASTAPSRASRIDVAITVDDLPHHGPDVPGQTRLSIHQAFVAAFRAHHVPPVYGFVNGGHLDSHPEERAALDAWVAAGNPVGNHTRTHPDLHQRPNVEAYLADVDANEPLLRDLSKSAAGGDRAWKVFRYPFLQEGTSLASRARIREHVLGRGYRIAQVTIDFYDWAYNAPYARCRERHDERAVEALKTSFLADAGLTLRWSDSAARAIAGRPIAQILLLHAGAFGALMIDELLALYEKQGVRFITLDEALVDPVYAQEPRVPTAWEGTFLEQVREARGMTEPPQPNLPEALLEALCR